MSTDIYVFLPPPTASGVQREAYPYGPALSGSGFNANLGVEISAAVGAQNPALAVVSGIARIIPDPALTPTCTLVLKPTPSAMRNMADLVGNGTVLFIYRNLSVSTVRSLFQARMVGMDGKRFVEPISVELRTDAFMEGRFSVGVVGSNELGVADSRTGAAGWNRLAFEIAFIPNGIGEVIAGSAARGKGWERVVQLVAPDNTITRRLDPASFYARAKAGGSNARLAPAHTNHALLNALTRRTLLEVRDEYDKPFVGTLDVVGAGGVQTSYTFAADNRGTVSLATIPAGSTAAPTTQTYIPQLSNHVFTELPSGQSASDAPPKALTPPAHWALQTIFMANVDDSKNWFVANIAPLPRYTANNKVTPIRDGVDTFRQYVAAMRTVKRPGHFMYLADWFLDDSFQMIPGDSNSTALILANIASSSGADVRALVWDDVNHGSTQENSNTVSHMNSIPNGHIKAILDDETMPFIGSHHQKFLVVNGVQGAFAFCGGVDINPDRLDSPHHGALGAFHDVHAKVEGPAVGDLHRTFVDRWNAHPDCPGAVSTIAPPYRSNAGSVFVQVARTYPAQKHYPFAPNGSLTPLQAISRAITKANKFIYIEDQYLTPYPGLEPATAYGDTVGILTALRAALPRIDYIIMVIPNHTDQPQGRSRRKLFIEGLRAVDASKVFVFYLGRASSNPLPQEVATKGGCDTCSGGDAHRDEIYVHSKTWIIDDVWAKIGSCNANRRGLTHDSELDVVMVDGALRNGGRAFARSYRKELWAEHLNMGGSRDLLEDHLQALAYWRSPPSGARIRPYDHNIGAHDPIPDEQRIWDITVDPDGR